jgi:hypothetical protein
MYRINEIVGNVSYPSYGINQGVKWAAFSVMQIGIERRCSNYPSIVASRPSVLVGLLHLHSMNTSSHRIATHQAIFLFVIDSKVTQSISTASSLRASSYLVRLHG